MNLRPDLGLKGLKKHLEKEHLQVEEEEEELVEEQEEEEEQLVEEQEEEEEELVEEQEEGGKGGMPTCC